MSHDWILDVLADLRRYALKNDLPRLARQVDAALRTARHELVQARPAPPTDGPDDGEGGSAPPGGRPN
jgi:hypothetical protein